MVEKAQIVIVGGGPSGAMLALELGKRNIPCILIEKKKNRLEKPLSKAVFTHGRSMEHFRRFNIIEKIDEKGISGDFPNSLVFSTGLNGHLSYFAKFSSRDKAKKTGKMDDMVYGGSGQSAELSRWIFQPYLEEILFEKMKDFPSINIRLGEIVTSATQNDEGIHLKVVQQDSGKEYEIMSKFVAAADGASSIIRKSTDIKLIQYADTEKMYAVLFKSNDLINIMTMPKGLLYIMKNAKAKALGLAAIILIHLNDKEGLWNFTGVQLPSFDPEKADPHAVLSTLTDEKFHYEIESVGTWNSNVICAEKFQEGGIFLVGDAAHQFPHTGGHGMNSGLGDACNLGWKLAAMIQGWGGQKLLETYQTERIPVVMNNLLITLANRARIAKVDFAPKFSQNRFIRYLQHKWIKWQLRHLRRDHILSQGLQLGFDYSTSPIIVSDGTAKPPTTTNTYIPTTRPGHLLPHSDMPDGSVLYDHLGLDFTLIKFDESVDTKMLEKKFAEKNIPLSVFVPKNFSNAALYKTKLVLVRPDQMVAWRGNYPENPDEIINCITGNF